MLALGGRRMIIFRYIVFERDELTNGRQVGRVLWWEI